MKKLKKVINVIVDILIVVVLMVSILIVVLSLTSKSSGVPNIFGYAPLSVQSDSMEPTFSEGDLIFAKVSKDPNERFEVNDVVSFNDTINGETVINTHRVVKIEYDESNGVQRVHTKGDNAPEEDTKVKTQYDILAKYIGTRIPVLGGILSYVRTQEGFFFCILLPMILFFVYEIIRVITNIMAYNREKAAEAAAETVANSELTEEQKQRAIAEYLAQQKEQAEIAPPQDSESEVQTPAADEATAPDDTAATAESPETAQDADPDETT